MISLPVPRLLDCIASDAEPTLAAMERAKDLIARTLPPVLFVGGTINQSVSQERLSATLMHPWRTFLQEVSDALRSLDLSGEVSLSDSVGNERFLVGCELGLTTRFVRNVCDPVAKALSVTSLSDTIFGDIYAVEASPTTIPDVVLLNVPNPDSPTPGTARLICVGELKTFWTFRLENYPADSTIYRRLNLEHHIGKCYCFDYEGS